MCSPKKTFIPREGFGDFGFVKISLYRKVILFFTSSFFMLIMEWILSFAIVIRKIADYMLRDILQKTCQEWVRLFNILT